MINKYSHYNTLCDVQGSVRLQDSDIYANKIGVELIKEAATESELNSIYLTQLLHHVDHSLILTLAVVCINHLLHVVRGLVRKRNEWCQNYFVARQHSMRQHSNADARC